MRIVRTMIVAAEWSVGLLRVVVAIGAVVSLALILRSFGGEL